MKRADFFAARIAATAISHDIEFFIEFLGQGIVPGITVDRLHCFPANCLYGGRNRLQVAV
ncbi:MAG: hypothetical protein DMF24_10800 [Verrucomicrobia bacterium]|nr:MAG: hypothetical protein DMF24_10800 [Verrucomicrobiota bacterium]